MNIPSFMNKIQEKGYVAPLLFITLLGLVHSVALGRIFFMGRIDIGDMYLMSSTLESSVSRFVSIWQPIDLGRLLANLPTLFYIESLTIFLSGGNIIFGEKLLFFGLPLLSTFTMWILLLRLTKSRFVRYIISFVYGINFLVIPEILHGNFPYLWIHALFPLFLLSLIYFFSKPNLKSTLVLIIVTGVMWSADYSVILFLGFFFAAFFITENFKKRSIKYFIKSTTTLLLVFGALLAIAAPFALDGVISLLNYLAQPGTSVGFYRGQDIAYMTSWLTAFYSWNAFYIFIGLTTFSAIIYFFIRKADSTNRRYYLTFLSLSLLTLIWWRTTQLEWTLDIIIGFPILLLLRDTTRIAFMLLWSFLIMLAISLDFFVARYRINMSNGFRKSIRSIGLFFLIGVVIILPMNTLVSDAQFNSNTGDQFKNTYQFFSGQLDFYQGEVPSLFYDALEWVNERRQNEGFFRTLWAPLDHRLSSSLLRLDDPLTLYSESHNQPYSKEVLSMITENKTNYIGSYLSSASVKYIIVLTGITEYKNWYYLPGYLMPPTLYFSGSAYQLYGQPSEYVKFFDDQEDLKIVENNSAYKIYENLEFKPLINVYNNLLLFSPPELVHKTPFVYSKTLDTDLFVNSSLDETPIINSSSNAWPNLIVNSGFEDNFDGWFGGDPKIGAEYVIDSLESHSGENSVRLVGGPNPPYGALVQYVPIEPGDYLLSAWVKAERISDNQFPRLEVMYLDSNYSLLSPPIYSGYNESAVQANKWSFLDLIISANSNVKFVHIGLKLLPDTAVWFDTVSLNRTNAISNIYKAGLDGDPNLIVNSGFEGNFLGWSQGDLRLGAEYVIDSLESHSGNNSVRILGGPQFPYGNIANYPRIKNSTTYYASAWVRTEDDDLFSNPQLELFFFDSEKRTAGSRKYSSGDYQSGEWFLLELVVTTPKNAEFGHLALLGSPSQNIWFDDIALIEIDFVPFNLRPELIISSGIETLNFLGITDDTTLIQSGLKPDVIQKTVVNIANIVFTEDISRSTESEKILKNANSLIIVNQAEFQLTQINGTWRNVQDDALSNKFGLLSVTDGVILKEFFAPRPGFYSLNILLKGNIEYLLLNDHIVNYSISKYQGLNLIQSENVYLESNEHNLIIGTSSATILDSVLIVNTKQADANYLTLVNHPNSTFNINSARQTDYVVEIHSQNETIITLGQSFHENWAAYSNGTQLLHFPSDYLSWSNGFYLNKTGENEVEIIFERQNVRNWELIISWSTWGFIIVALVFVSLERAGGGKVKRSKATLGF